ncbi:hypothetical protein [Sphingomonas sp.]|uniref:hypothetical protein n=1 Tax=Sphingomonas sp. TaxID=28214 RepID=UPI002ED86C11
MDTNTLIAALANAGPFGIMCWILLQQRKEDRAERRELDEQRLAYDKDRLATDKALSASLMALAIKITGKPIDVEKP